MGFVPPPPPPSDDGDKKNTQNASDPLNFPHDPDTIIFSASFPSRHKNPSLALFWGPLMPAADNLPATYTMIGLQFLLGTMCLRRARHLFQGTVMTKNGLSPMPRKRVRSLLPGLGGSLLVFGSGLELARCCMPYDPWYDEAKQFRRMAIREGKRPSAWFGALDSYTPMLRQEWLDKLGEYVLSAEQRLAGAGFLKDKPPSAPGQTRLGVALGKKQKFLEIYALLAETSKNRRRELLENDLKDVTELNRVSRIDAVLDGTSQHRNQDYEKPRITLGNQSIESDQDFDYVWQSFDPWSELKDEVSYEIRLIPQLSQANPIPALTLEKKTKTEKESF